MPVNTDSTENSTTAGTSTRRRPSRSDSTPTKIAETPHATPSAPTRLPRSCGVRPRSLPIWAANSGGRIQRSSPTRPKPTVSSSTILNSYPVSQRPEAPNEPADALAAIAMVTSL